MSTLQIPQILALASNAGFSGADLATAVAVALAESNGGNPQAYNPERAAGAAQGQGSFGLWQIYLQAHPEFAGQNLFDPQINAAAAYAIYAAAGNSFRPWTTFLSGAYRVQLEAVNQVLSTSSDTTASDSGAPDTGQILSLVVGGAVIFWLIGRVMGW